jgi:Cof subfamily protein (haloacid dehalogenase superfamily)
MLASDLDGTLVRSDGTISDASRLALERAVDAGLLVAFVTGRPPRWLHEIADQTGHTGIAVAANGAVIYDLKSETVVREHPLAPDLLAAITSQLRAAFPAVRFGVEYGMNFGYEPGYRHDWEISPSHDRRGDPIPPPLVADLEQIINRPAVKLLAKDRDADPDRFMAAAARVLAGRATVTHSSRQGLLEIAAAGVTKASGLAEVASRHGISASEVVAVGDMPNDVPMLEWAGRSYAVANAHPAAIAAADELLPTNDEDAVAILINSLLGHPPRP